MPLRTFALLLLIGASSCGHSGGEGERCRHTESGAECLGRLTCVEFDFECGLGPPFLPCQDEACLDCSDEENAAGCDAARNDDEDADSSN